MLRKISVVLLILMAGFALGSCSTLFGGQDDSLDSTRIAMAVQQTQLAIEQEQAAQTQAQP